MKQITLTKKSNEHRAGFDEANLEAHLQFNNCRKCNSWVCDDCFCAGDIRHGGVCKVCKEKEVLG